jgi:hypothetical protein
MHFRSRPLGFAARDSLVGFYDWEPDTQELTEELYDIISCHGCFFSKDVLDLHEYVRNTDIPPGNIPGLKESTIINAESHLSAQMLKLSTIYPVHCESLVAHPDAH